MKTLIIRSGARHFIRAIAFESDDGGRDRCPVLKFFQEQASVWGSEMTKLGGILSDTANSGPPSGDNDKFKKLPGTDDLYEFKSPQGLRLICFWDDGLIICTHGYVKDCQKAPKSVLQRGNRMKREYFEAKRTGALTHA